ncbi:MAG: hypothetical protein LEGION0403_FIIPPAGN_01180 [Legionella sp.]|uniref:DDE-type integrase/transposase/recombinase n=1 Tax=Legionella sp. TaxID=459 RepID=UPI003D148D27
MKKRESKPSDKWHLDEQQLRIRGATYYLWRAVDDEGYELDVFLPKRRNKKAAIRFLSRLLNAYPKPMVIAKKLFETNSPDVQRSRASLA